MSITTNFFFIKIVHFRAFRFDWYMYEKRQKNLLFSRKGAEEGGQSLGDMTPKKSLFYALPYHGDLSLIIFFQRPSITGGQARSF